MIIKISKTPSVIKILYSPLCGIGKVSYRATCCVSDSLHFAAIVVKVIDLIVIRVVFYDTINFIIKICDCPLIIPVFYRACIINRIYCSCRNCVIKICYLSTIFILHSLYLSGIIHIVNIPAIIDKVNILAIIDCSYRAFICAICFIGNPSGEIPIIIKRNNAPCGIIMEIINGAVIFIIKRNNAPGILEVISDIARVIQCGDKGILPIE